MGDSKGLKLRAGHWIEGVVVRRQMTSVGLCFPLQLGPGANRGFDSGISKHIQAVRSCNAACISFTNSGAVKQPVQVA